SLRRMAKRSKTAVVAYKIYENWNAKRLFRSGNNESILGSTHRKLSLSESVSYIVRQFDEYLAYGNLHRDDLANKRILEIGFGDKLGVALKCLAAGASQLICIDKFYSKRDEGQQQKIYAALRETLTADERLRFDTVIDSRGQITLDPLRLSCVYGVGVES